MCASDTSKSMKMNPSDKDSCPCGIYIPLFNNIYTILTIAIEGYYYYFADEETKISKKLSNLTKVTEELINQNSNPVLCSSKA